MNKTMVRLDAFRFLESFDSNIRSYFYNLLLNRYLGMIYKMLKCNHVFAGSFFVSTIVIKNLKPSVNL